MVSGNGGGSTAAQEGNTRRARDLLTARNVKFEELDGNDIELKDKRNAFFAVSGIRGQYPQLFKIPVDGESGGTAVFVGDWEKIESLNECDDIPTEVLSANPSIVTLAMTLADCQKI